MDDGVQNGPQPDQWLPTHEKGERRAGSLGALRFIRTRSSIRRELKRQCYRNKTGDSYGAQDSQAGSGGGGIGKWLREHLGGGSKGGHDVSSALPAKGNATAGDNAGNNKSLIKAIYTSQNLYCSLPREHGRYAQNGARKIGHGGSAKSQGFDRPRSNSVNHHEKPVSGDLGILTRGGPIYGSEGRSLKKRNRDRRRYSLHEAHDQGHHRRRSVHSERATFIDSKSESSVATTRSGMTENGADGGTAVDEDDPGVRLYPGVGTSVGNREDLAPENGWEEGGEEGEKETPIDEADEFLLWDEESPEYEYEYEGTYGEYDGDEGITEEDGKDVPSAATISAAEKPEEEDARREDAEPDHAPDEIPAEIFIDHEEMTKRHKELLAEHVELRRRNRLLEAWILKYIKKTQEKVMPTVDEHLKEHMEQTYIQALYAYERQLGDITRRRARITADMQTHEDRARELREEDARLMGEFLDREREVATGLIYAKTGRKITEKAVNEITCRQVSRRAALVRSRYEHIFLRRRLDDVKTQVQSLETLGEGMTAADYEALRMSYTACRDKLDERDREIEKLRHKIAEAVNGVAHCKEKGTCLADDIEFEGRELDEYREQTARAREDVNRLHLILRDLQRTQDEKRLEAGLMMAQPVLREMERTMRSLDAVRNDIEIIKREIQPRGSARRQEEQRGDVDDDAGQTGVVSK